MTRKSSHLLFATAALAGLAGMRSFNFDKEGAVEPPAGNVDVVTARREEFSRLQTEAQGVIDAALKADRELTKEEKEANDRRFSRMNQIKAMLDDQAKFAALALQGKDGAKGTVTKPTEPPGREEYQRSLEKTVVEVIDKDNAREFAKAMNNWASTGEMDRKFATITTATTSKALLPKDVGEPLVPTATNTFRDALAIYNQIPVQSSTTAELEIPVITPSADGAVVAEDASSETEAAPTIAKIALNVATYQSKSAWFSNRVLLANDFDLVSFVRQDLVYAKELGFEAAIGAGIVADAGITNSVATATTTGLIYDNLVSLNRALPKRFSMMNVIILQKAAFVAAEKLVGDDGHPVLVKDPQVAGLMRFNGTPVLWTDYLENFGASKVVGVIMSLRGFKLRDVTTQVLHRYTQTPAKPDQTGFNLVGYHAYGYTPAAMATLKTPAS